LNAPEKTSNSLKTKPLQEVDDMRTETVLVRADRGKPLKRLLMDVDNGLAYLANPSRIEAIRAGKSDPVGFPLEDVFIFDGGVLADLEGEWGRCGRTDPATWGRLSPYRAS
jgi:hypothetical protein